MKIGLYACNAIILDGFCKLGTAAYAYVYGKKKSCRRFGKRPIFCRRFGMSPFWHVDHYLVAVLTCFGNQLVAVLV